MATSLRLMPKVLRLLRSPNKCLFSSSSRRLLLSEAYSCNDAWKKYLQDPTLNQVSFVDFSEQIHDHLQKNKEVSAVDMNVLVHQLHNMEERDVDLIEDIIARFNLCQTSYPQNDSTTYALIRGFLSTNNGDRLPTILQERLTYGVFPNHYALNILMNSFIKQEDFHNAAKISYSSMIQEDFSNSVNALLALYSSVKHLLTSNIDDLAPPPKEQSDGEENWVKVKYIRFPYYDDHFDIKDERFLLGKTLLVIGKIQCVDLPTDIRKSIKLIGCGLYHKFNKGLELIKDIVKSSDGSISQQALDYFSSSLEKVKARDPNEPEVELALRTIDDVIHRLLPTTEEKTAYQQEFIQLKEQLLSQGKIKADFDLDKSVTEFVTANLAMLEEPDIIKQKNLFNLWTEERKKEIENQIAEFKKQKRIEEIKRQVKEVKEQEELLTYFDFEEKIRLHFVEEDQATNKNLTISK